jgi:hypothetical protein
MTEEAWVTHVRYEIMDACADKIRLLEITECLIQMERADLIPEDIASSLMDLIQNINHR